MDIDWKGMELLLGILEHHSLNGAAKALGIAQATASRRLAQLEAQVGSALFDRTPEGLMPRELALDLAPHARLIAGHLSDIERVAAGREAAPQGRVRLAVVEGFVSAWLAARLPAFLDRFPGLELDVLAGNPVADLVHQEADLAIRLVPPQAADLVMRRLGYMENRPFAHPSLAPMPRRWVALHDPGEIFAETRWLREHVQPSQLLRVSHWTDLFACVRHGVGAGLLTPLVALAHGLVPLDIQVPAVRRELFMVYHRSMRDVPRVAVVRDWIVEQAQVFDQS